MTHALRSPLGSPGAARASPCRASASPAAGFLTRRPAPPPTPGPRPQRLGVRAAATADEEANMSGEWPVNWSLASYEDVGEFFQANMFKDSASPGTSLKSIMKAKPVFITPDTPVSELKALLDKVTGVPVVKSDTDLTLVGVLSKKDLVKAGSVAKDIMSTPPIAAKPSNKVADAACLMLKHKVHRIPVVDEQAKLLGIVTRTDIFEALSSGQV